MAFEAIKQKALEAKKAAAAAKSRDRGAVYKQAFRPNDLGRAGGYDGRGRLAESRGYSYVRALAAAYKAIDPEDAKEECEADAFLKKTYKTHAHPSRCMLAVASSRMLPETYENSGQTWHEMKQFKDEMRQKVAAYSHSGLDLDHPAVRSWLAAKGLDDQHRIKTMTSTVDTSGGTFVPAPAQGELIDLQRNFEAFTRAGSREVNLPPQGRILLPKQVGGSTAYWLGDPNAGASLSDLTTGQLSLEAKLLVVLTNVSDQLLRFSDPSIEALIRYDQAMQAGLAADTAMFTGTGGTQIKGLLTYPQSAADAAWVQGTDKVLLRTASTVATDGNTFQPQDAIKMSQILPDPVQAMPKTFVFYTPQAVALMSRRADAVTTADQAGPFVFQINRDPETGLPNGLYGNKVVTSYNVPSNRVKGSGTNLTLVLVGAFSDWIVGRSGVVEFDANPFTNFSSVQTQMRTIQYLDAGPRHLASFCVCDTLLPTT